MNVSMIKGLLSRLKKKKEEGEDYHGDHELESAHDEMASQEEEETPEEEDEESPEYQHLEDEMGVEKHPEEHDEEEEGEPSLGHHILGESEEKDEPKRAGSHLFPKGHALKVMIGVAMARKRKK